MSDDSNSCLVGLLKLIVTVVFIGGIAFILIRSCASQAILKVTNNYITVAKQSGVLESKESYEKMFNAAFNDGKWEQIDNKGSGYPAVTYTATYTDESGKKNTIKYIFAFEERAGVVEGDVVGCQLNGAQYGLFDGLTIAYMRSTLQSPAIKAMLNP